MDALCVGALLAILARREGGAALLVRYSGRAALVAGAAILLVSALGAATHRGLAVLHPIRGTLHALFFGALTLTSVQQARRSTVARVFHSSWLRTFGKYSYGLYVYHGVLSIHMLELRVEDRLGALLGSHSLAIAAQTVVGVGVSLLISVVSYELFEKRFLVLKKLFAPEVGTPPRPLPQPVTAGRPVGGA